EIIEARSVPPGQQLGEELEEGEAQPDDDKASDQEAPESLLSAAWHAQSVARGRRRPHCGISILPASPSREPAGRPPNSRIGRISRFYRAGPLSAKSATRARLGVVVREPHRSHPRMPTLGP